MSEELETIKNKVHKIMDHLDIDNFSFTSIIRDYKHSGFLWLGNIKEIKNNYNNIFIYGKKSDKIVWHVNKPNEPDFEFSELNNSSKDNQIHSYKLVYDALKKLLKKKMDQENFDQYCEKALGFKP